MKNPLFRTYEPSDYRTFGLESSHRIIDVPGCDDVSNFADRISFAEHGKLVVESSEFHLTLAERIQAHFFQPEIPKKSGTF